MYKIIDLSKYNTVNDWAAVKENVAGVIIRCGYRGYGTGKVVQDAKFVEFAQACKKNSIPFGIYFMSQAVTVAEAEEEALYVANFAEQYGATMPLFIDSEDGDGTAKIVRADGLEKVERTTIATAFCETVKAKGKVPGVYASESWFNSNLDYVQLKEYTVWCAKYGTNTGEPQTKPALGKVDMWQYTSNGAVPGITGAVDLSECYITINSVEVKPAIAAKLTYINNEKVGAYQHAANCGFDAVGTTEELSEDNIFGPKSQAFAKAHLIYFGIKGSPTAVKWWQGIIGVKQDGVFGSKTLEATRQWQAEHGLVSDGVVGIATVTAAIK